MSNGNPPPTVIRALTQALAALAIAGFAAVSIYSFVLTFEAQGSPPQLNAAYLYVTAALSALVGGIVAIGFGQKPPPPNPTVQPANNTTALVQRNFASLGSVLTNRTSSGVDKVDKVDTIIGSAYYILYILFGAAAIVVWLVKANVVADPVKALASTFIGLVLPIIRGYFPQSSR